MVVGPFEFPRTGWMAHHDSPDVRTDPKSSRSLRRPDVFLLFLGSLYSIDRMYRCGVMVLFSWSLDMTVDHLTPARAAPERPSPIVGAGPKQPGEPRAPAWKWGKTGGDRERGCLEGRFGWGL